MAPRVRGYTTTMRMAALTFSLVGLQYVVFFSFLGLFFGVFFFVFGFGFFVFQGQVVVYCFQAQIWAGWAGDSD